MLRREEAKMPNTLKKRFPAIVKRMDFYISIMYPEAPLNTTYRTRTYSASGGIYECN